MNMHTTMGLMRATWVITAMLLTQAGCSRSENGNEPERSRSLPDTTQSSTSDLPRSLIGQWQPTNGERYVITFTDAGLMSIRNASGESQVRMQGNDEFAYTFIAENVLKAGAALSPEHADLFPGQWFEFSVLVEGDSLIIRGSQDSLQVTLTQDGTSEWRFPGSEGEPLKLIRVAP